MDGCLAFNLLTDKELSRREFTEGMALAVCDKVADGVSGCVVMATRGSRRAAIHSHVARCGHAGLPHDMFNGRVLGLGGTQGEGA